jgi:hypothetical protein
VPLAQLEGVGEFSSFLPSVPRSSKFVIPVGRVHFIALIVVGEECGLCSCPSVRPSVTHCLRLQSSPVSVRERTKFHTHTLQIQQLT